MQKSQTYSQTIRSPSLGWVILFIVRVYYSVAPAPHSSPHRHPPFAFFPYVDIVPTHTLARPLPPDVSRNKNSPSNVREASSLLLTHRAFALPLCRHLLLDVCNYASPGRRLAFLCIPSGPLLRNAVGVAREAGTWNELWKAKGEWGRV